MDTERQVCYRHPDRETRLACSECGRLICVECSLDAAVGQKCPECARPEGRARVIRVRPSLQTGRGRAPATYTLIAINVVVFLLSLSNSLDLNDRFADIPNAIETAGEWWRVVTAMFLHGGSLHLLVNMYALWILGPIIERRFGALSFCALYLASGIAGGALFQVMSPAFELVRLTSGEQVMVPVSAVGASGAIFGLFGVLLAAAFRRRQDPGGATLFNQLVMLLALNLALPFVVPRIAWQAHLGGLAAGIIIVLLWERVPLQRPRAAAYRVAIALAIGATALATVLFL